MTNQKHRNEKKKSSTVSTVLKIVLILGTSALICVAVYAVYLTKTAEQAVTLAHEKIAGRDYSYKRDERVEPIKDNVSILLIGIDDSETRAQGADYSRADAIMVATLNNRTKSVKLLSIPRDSDVYIPSLGYRDKITHSHSLGGTLSTIESVEELLEIPIDYYVRMNFNAFIDVVDALGGVEANVPYKLLEKDEFDRTAIELEPGIQTLNGSEALAFARTRKQDTDVDRGKRQQELVQAIMTKVASAGSVFKYDDVIRAVGDNMKTDLTFGEIKSFLHYLSSGMPRVDTMTLLGEDYMAPGVYYYELDEDALATTRATLQRHLGLPVTDEDKENTINMMDEISNQQEQPATSIPNLDNSQTNYLQQTPAS